MSEAADTTLLRFTAEDLELFRTASHDHNPLHSSDVYARRTPFGTPVVFGVLAAIACLGRLRPRRGQTLSTIGLDFRAPIFPGVDYSVEAREPSRDRAELSLLDGRQILLRAVVTLQDGVAEPPPDNPGPAWANHLEPVDRQPAEFAPGLQATGTYTPDWSLARGLMERFHLRENGVGALQVAALLWSSYMVGMELPGRTALFARLSLRFQPSGAPVGGPLTYVARVRTIDRRSLLVTADVQLAVSETPWAVGEASALVRQDVPGPSLAAIEALLPRSEALQGKVGLIIGASRGLGAALSQAFASQGCTVMASYYKTAAEAERLRQSCAATPGAIELVRGDAADLEWCEEVRDRVKREHGHLDFLICNAAPALLPMRLHARTVGRVNDYVYQSLGLVSVPLAVFMPLVSQQGGWLVTISSSVIAAPPADWPHYVSAKYAIEGMTRATAADQRAASFLIVRPPRLLTDLVNTPIGREGAIPPERVAAQIVRHLFGPAAPGRVQVLEDFA
ncbi:MAG: SDR family NAD(P)-dependent oxidoreductase [Chloroflexota bacterium]|nr:SDR family NAD(P)-dependent oxidoreductase [Chloroflexota bacterium]